MSDELEQPKGEKPILIPPVWALIFFAAIYFVGQATPGLFAFGPIQQGAGLLLAGAGLAIAIAGLVQFQRHKTTYKPEVPGKASALVTDGVYRLTRNPMYVGMALILAGEAVWLGTLLGFLLVPVFIGVLTAVQIVPEERALTRLFGDEFLVFKHRTPRWLFL